MSAADFFTNITAKGTQEELKATLKFLRNFEKVTTERYNQFKDCAYIQFDLDVSDSNLEAMVANAKDGELQISGIGPYGRFSLLEDVALFKQLAKEVPTASFSGEMSGFNPGGEQSLTGELRDGLLYLKFSLISSYDDPWDSSHIFNPKTGKYVQ